jgi:hypothetical protein
MPCHFTGVLQAADASNVIDALEVNMATLTSTVSGAY